MKSLKNIKIKIVSLYILLKRKLKKTSYSFFNAFSTLIFEITGYHLFEFSNAAASASLLLISVKIVYYFFFAIQLSATYNLSLLLVFLGVSLMYNLHFYFRYFMYNCLKMLLGEYFFGFKSYKWTEIKNSNNQ